MQRSRFGYWFLSVLFACVTTFFCFAVAGCGNGLLVSHSLSAPVFSPSAGNYTVAQTVTISDSTPGASIYYTVDGSNPTSGSTPYSAPLVVSSSTTIKAIATVSTLGSSAIATATYTMVPPPILLPGAIVCWGDSMTQGRQGVVDTGDYPSLLQQETQGTVVNNGIGGQTSTQIGVRQGGIPTYVTVVGGSIPASAQTGVQVTFQPGYEPLTSSTGMVYGSILGVYGALTLSSALPSGTYTFTRLYSGSTSVSAPGTPQFVPINTFAYYPDYFPIFWEGRNNIFSSTLGPWGPTQIMSDLAAQVATVPQGQNYLVLSIANQDIPSEIVATYHYNPIVALNKELAATYGEHYLDIRAALVNAYDPSLPTDVSDFKYDTVPTSLRSIYGQGTLSSGIGPTDTSFTVNLSIGSIPTTYMLTIDNENIYVVSVNGSTVTSAVRGFGGVIAPHAAGAAVSVVSPIHLNKQGSAVVARTIAAKLATLSNAATPGPPGKDN